MCIRDREDRISLRYVLDQSRYSLDDLMRRGQMLISAILSNLTDFLETRKYDLIPYIRDLGGRLREISQLLTRIIITHLKRREFGRFLRLRSASHVYASTVLLMILRDLLEELLSLSEALPKLKKKIWSNQEIYDVLREALRRGLQMFDDAMNTYFSLNFERANQILNIHESELSSAIEDVIKERKLKDYEVVFFAAYLSVFLRNFVRKCHEIAQLTLDIFVETENKICKIEE